jgi:hypothetical protein
MAVVTCFCCCIRRDRDLKFNGFKMVDNSSFISQIVFKHKSLNYTTRTCILRHDVSMG